MAAPGRRALAVAVLTVVTLLAACAPGTYRPRPTYSYTPLPEAELYRRIAALPHVKDVGITYQDTFENGRKYDGYVTTDSKENPYLILDESVAILRQGKSDAFVSLDINYPGPPGGRDLSLHKSLSLTELLGRYGPQPGNGLPPAGPPVPTPTDWPPPAR